MNIIGELPRQFIADLKEDPTRLKDRAWDMYSEEVRKVCNWLEIRWMKHEIAKLRREYVRTLGSVLKLNPESAREMMGAPSYKSQPMAGAHTTSSQLQNSLYDAVQLQRHANRLLGKME